MREMNADTAQQIDQIVLSAIQVLRGIVESGVLSVSRDPGTRAAVRVHHQMGNLGVKAPPNESGRRLENMITQYIDKLDEAAALQLGRGGSRARGGEKAASICEESFRGIPPCPEGEEICTLMRNAVGYLACLDDDMGSTMWLKENGLVDTNQQIYGALNDEMRNRFQ